MKFEYDGEIQNWTAVLAFVNYSTEKNYFSKGVSFPAGIYMLKVNNRITRTSFETCSRHRNDANLRWDFLWK